MISFVGAGPGAPDLITLRGADRLARAEIVIFASSLVPEALLEHTTRDAVIYDSAGMTLEDVLELYRAAPEARTVRLHSGDPSIYGAIQEQIDWCVAAGRDFEIVPGVSSFTAAAAALRRELTIPRIAQSVVLTRLAGRTRDSMPQRETLAAFSAIGATTAVFLAGARARELVAELLAPGSAYTAHTPAAVVVRVSWPDEQVLRTIVGRLEETIASTAASRTVLVLVGDALAPPTGDGSAPRSHLYSPDYAHAFRKRSTRGTTTGRPVSRRARRAL